MARDEDNAVEGKDFVWVPMKDSKGNIVKDGKGNPVKTRKFGKNLAPETSPRPKARPTTTTSKKAAPAPSSPRPKARPAEKPKIVGPVTKAPQVTGSAKGSGIAGSVGTAVGKGIARMTNNPPAKAPNRAEAYKSQTNPDAKRLKKLREDLAAQKRRSSVKSGMTLRERNMP